MSPGSSTPSRKLRAGGGAEGWWVPGPPPFVGRQPGDGNSKRSGVRAFFFFSPSKQPSCVFWGPVNHSSSSGKRGEEYMTQPSKNAGRLGACAEEARNLPQAGGCLPAVPPSPSQLAGPGTGTAARGTLRAEPGIPCCREPGTQQRGEPRLSATAVKPHFSSRSGCFQDFKIFHVCSAEGMEKNPEKRGWSAFGEQCWAGRQDPSHWAHRFSQFTSVPAEAGPNRSH